MTRHPIAAFVLLAFVTLLGNAHAQGQPAAATLPDSALAALKGRQVEVTTRSGLSAKGELAAFDAKTVTIIKPDGKMAVIARTDIGELAIAQAADRQRRNSPHRRPRPALP